ncbi:hypothetical protein AOQ84DRAFT_401335 [Glonium stellatum]|uniref:Amino acid permease n=1 Tax=Glonium stellatum TaxID=574774 RepID=A0A8E2JM67_9PEZI|nr:hypothetical protein AOQ84DRAFT_401335 [Glonium stellatum]
MYSTEYDKRDMNRIGRRQVLRRNFRFFSIFGYAVILGTGISTLNGGPAGAIWLFFITCIGIFFVTLSIAEMASIQYHWASEFTPRRYQKFISYIVGWLCVLGWHAGMATTTYATAQQFEALIALNVPSYVIKGWHGTLFSTAITLFAIAFNTILVRKLPVFEGIVFFLHVSGFIAFMAVLWTMSPHSNSLGTSTLTAVMSVLLLFCVVNNVTTSSRQLFAFSRDRGLPFWKWLSTVIGLISSYIVAITCMAIRQFSSKPLLPSRFSLGRPGIFINCAALAFLSVADVFLFFSAAPNPTPAVMNWSRLIYAAVVTISLLYYAFKGRHTYEGPIEYVRKDV